MRHRRRHSCSIHRDWAVCALLCAARPAIVQLDPSEPRRCVHEANQSLRKIFGVRPEQHLEMWHSNDSESMGKWQHPARKVKFVQLHRYTESLPGWVKLCLSMRPRGYEIISFRGSVGVRSKKVSIGVRFLTYDLKPPNRHFCCAFRLLDASSTSFGRPTRRTQPNAAVLIILQHHWVLRPRMACELHVTDTRYVADLSCYSTLCYILP